MAYGMPSSPDDPRQMLATTRSLTRTVRRAQGAAWFAPLVFGAMTLLAAPFLRYGPRFRHCAATGGHTIACTVYPTLALWYWPIALVVGYAAIAWFYLRRSRKRGVGSRVQPFIGVGMLIGLLAAAWAVWGLTHPVFLAETLRVGPSVSGNVVFRLTSPAGAIGLALFVLAWVERTWLLAVIAAVYLAVVGVRIGDGRIAHASAWGFLPHLLLLAGILLLAAGVLALLRRVSTPPTP